MTTYKQFGYLGAGLIASGALLLAFTLFGQVQLPPLPPVNTNILAKCFVPPLNQRQHILIEFDYTNVIFPIESTTDMVTWVPEGFATGATVRIIFPTTNAPVKFYRASSALYYGEWSWSTNPTIIFTSKYQPK